MEQGETIRLQQLYQKVEQHERTISQLVEIIAVLNRQIAVLKEGTIKLER
ncbi:MULTISPECIES: hypothetical protein [Virgibacillus]|nr:MULTISPECIES: hypothetical protein [Virgibacillus]MBS7430168.1 hypothetical protein [Virgibacillus sp. 19R1-5]MBU8566274.1 hypothetical protein [Virgibacillus pantothenticus]MBU8600699.1 hypothetical protein [Virgibacillus pantothenticus]MBU8634593.1 hypothetical protein [Virgibacillus pantothenticus]MBU8640804.1 hypothetical protein [Virgibacillus pantothenticus]